MSYICNPHFVSSTVWLSRYCQDPRFPKPCPRAVRLPKSSSARTRLHTHAVMRARRPLISYALFNQSPEGLWNFLLSIISIRIILLNCCFSIQLQDKRKSIISANMTQTGQTQRNYEFFFGKLLLKLNLCVLRSIDTCLSEIHDDFS